MTRKLSELANEKEYHKGDIVGEWHVKLLEEPYRGKAKTSYRRARVQCPYCENTYIATIDGLERGKFRSCGCAKNAFRTAARRGIASVSFDDILSIMQEPKARNRAKESQIDAERYCIDSDMTEQLRGIELGPSGNVIIECYCTKSAEHPHAKTSREAKFTCYENCDDCDQDNSFVAQITRVMHGQKSTCGRTVGFFDTTDGTKKLAKKNLTGLHFGSLEVLYPDDKYPNGEPYQFTSYSRWRCRCTCGEELTATLYDLKSGRITRCTKCRSFSTAEKLRKTIPIGTRFGKLVVGNYIDCNNPEHPNTYQCICDCGRTCFQDYYSLSSGHSQSCGCVISLGEENIATALNTLDIEFSRQESFDNHPKYQTCLNPKTNQKLKFDFYLHKYNLCIEFDGEQHFTEKGAGYFHASLEDIQFRDSVKDEFCRVNGISLLRIPYTCRDSIDAGWLLEALRPYVGENVYRERLALLAVGGV